MSGCGNWIRRRTRFVAALTMSTFLILVSALLPSSQIALAQQWTPKGMENVPDYHYQPGPDPEGQPVTKWRSTINLNGDKCPWRGNASSISSSNILVAGK